LLAHIRVAASPKTRGDGGIGHAMRLKRSGGEPDLYILIAPLPAGLSFDGNGETPMALLIIETARARMSAIMADTLSSGSDFHPGKRGSRSTSRQVERSRASPPGAVSESRQYGPG
jgi:hypothetical protein